MGKIFTKNYGTDIIHKYSLDQLANRTDSLSWIGTVSLLSEITVKRIVAEDYKSFHDGTVSNEISIHSVSSFVASFENSPYKGIDIDALLDLVPFSLGINLDTCEVVLAYQSKHQLNLEKLELLLDLV